MFDRLYLVYYHLGTLYGDAYGERDSEMPRFRDGFPRPKKEYHHGAWRIYWRWNGNKYSVQTGITDRDDEKNIEAMVRILSGQMASDTRPNIPQPWCNQAGMNTYLDARYGKPEAVAAPLHPEQWLEKYAVEIASECDVRWAKLSVGRLERFAAYIEGLDKANPDNVSTYLSAIAKEHSIATRNRYLITLSRFYKWARRTGKMTVIPTDGIKTVKEAKKSAIVYCTQAERAEIIAMAETTGWQEWIAVPIAFYAGLRREEISRLEWPDVRFNAGLIVVRKTKTGRPREVPLSAVLERILLDVPDSQRHGPVMKSPDGLDRLWRMDNLVRNIQKAKLAKLEKELAIDRPPPSRSKDYQANKTAYLAQKKECAAQIKAALQRIGWNSFRHTFGSLLAQNGVSIDKISSWMGNTPEVCRRHYAQFVPRDRRDHEIDRL